MNEFADRWAGMLVGEDQALAGEFEARLADSSQLAFRVAYSVLRQREDAEDVAQEAFVRAHGAFRQLRDRERFRAWLVRMTWRMALDHRRGSMRRTRRELHAEVPDHPPSNEDALIAAERSARLWQAIDALPEKLRLVIVLSSIEGHGLSDVAALTGAPEGTIKSRLFKGRRRLQELLR
jgi:RNA polymerase sigma-70 factor (ECF subfamily)